MLPAEMLTCCWKLRDDLISPLFSDVLLFLFWNFISVVTFFLPCFYSFLPVSLPCLSRSFPLLPSPKLLFPLHSYKFRSIFLDSSIWQLGNLIIQPLFTLFSQLLTNWCITSISTVIFSSLDILLIISFLTMKTFRPYWLFLLFLL